MAIEFKMIFVGLFISNISGLFSKCATTCLYKDQRYVYFAEMGVIVEWRVIVICREWKRIDKHLSYKQ